MRHKKNIWSYFVLCLAVVFASLMPMTAYGAADWPSEVAIEADGGILMDAETGTILYGKNINEAYYPASITKLLTAQVVLDRCKLDETVEFSQNAVYNVEQGSKSLSMDTGDRMSVKDSLYGLILHSANEVANALAEHAAGSTEEFAKLMNQKAEELGCTGSNFVNPSGLNDPEHYTTAYDMALIARAALNYSEIVEIMGTRVYKIPPSQKAPEGQTISPGHKMLKKNDAAYDSRVFGGKTGFTSLAGNTLVTYAKKDDMTLIAVILNGHQTHYTDTKKLLDFGFSRFQSMKLTDYEGSLVPENHLTYSDSNTDQSLLLLNQNSRIVLPKEADLSAVVPIVSYDETSLTPSGTVVTVNYLYGERTVGHAWISPNPAVRSRLTRSAVPEGLSDQAAPGGRFRMNLSRGWLLAAGAAVALAAVACGILFFLKRQKIREARVAAVRKHRREQWMQESGCSAEEFEALLAKRKGSSGKKRRH